MKKHVPGKDVVGKHIVVTVPVELKSLAGSFQDLIEAAIECQAHANILCSLDIDSRSPDPS